MRTTFPTSIVVATLAVFACAPAMAWNDVGHKATAALAFDLLSGEAQLAAGRILMSHPRFEQEFAAPMPEGVRRGSEREQARWLFLRASIWPDLARQIGGPDKERFNRSTWHYINHVVWLHDDDRAALDGTLTHNKATRFEPPLKPGMNAVQALRGNLAIWHDESASAADKALALSWILHIAGDLHQPLHNVALFSVDLFPAGDRGGNLIEVEDGAETHTLHFVWDWLPSDIDGLAPDAKLQRTLDGDMNSPASFEAWLEHHANLARLFVYSGELTAQFPVSGPRVGPLRVRLSERYLDDARSVARRQLILAGHRMARLLVAPMTGEGID
jgi:hypothetical protein